MNLTLISGLKAVYKGLTTKNSIHIKFSFAYTVDISFFPILYYNHEGHKDHEDFCFVFFACFVVSLG